ncbi:hypothetical protein [Vibrio phage vB_pir03]|nr:hypothetical protein [Vibrio phage vB_pir03]
MVHDSFSDRLPCGSYLSEASNLDCFSCDAS